MARCRPPRLSRCGPYATAPRSSSVADGGHGGGRHAGRGAPRDAGCRGVHDPMAAASRPLAASLAANAYPLAVASAVFIIAVGLPSTDSDTYWQLATGQWMLGHREFLRQDVFSSTVAGTHFGIGEWLGPSPFAASLAASRRAGIARLGAR